MSKKSKSKPVIIDAVVSDIPAASATPPPVSTPPPPAPDSPIVCTLTPQPDMTAAELAAIMPYMIPRVVQPPLYQADWDRLGTATRHLVRS